MPRHTSVITVLHPGQHLCESLPAATSATCSASATPRPVPPKQHLRPYFSLAASTEPLHRAEPHQGEFPSGLLLRLRLLLRERERLREGLRRRGGLSAGLLLRLRLRERERLRLLLRLLLRERLRERLRVLLRVRSRPRPRSRSFRSLRAGTSPAEGGSGEE